MQNKKQEMGPREGREEKRVEAARVGCVGALVLMWARVGCAGEEMGGLHVRVLGKSLWRALCEARAWVLIVALCTGGACVFGILNDQITGRICFEYFSKGFHENMAKQTGLERILRWGPRSPTYWGIVWGIAATWWVGAALGVLMAMVARAGPWPQVAPGQLVHPVACLIGLLGLGVAGTALASRRYFEVEFPENEVEGRLTWYDVMPDINNPMREETGRRYLWCAHIHNHAYMQGFALGLVGVAWTAWMRWRQIV